MMATSTLLGRLAAACGVVISVVHDAEPLDLSRVVPAEDPAAVLDDLVARQPGYRWSRVRGRHVLYPIDEVWQRRIALEAAGPRADVADALLAELRQRFPELADLAGVVVRGDPRAPEYAAVVRLEGEDEVIAHLAGVLGGDGGLAFAVERAGSQQRVMHFERVPEAE